MYAVDPFLNFFRADGIDLVQDDHVGFSHLCIQQELHFLRQVDVRILRHDHTDPLRIHDAHEWHEGKLSLFLIVKFQIYMIQSTDAASRYIGEDDVSSGVFQLVELVYKILMLVAYAVA